MSRSHQIEKVYRPSADRLLESLTDPVMGSTVRDKLMNLFPEAIRAADGTVKEFV